MPLALKSQPLAYFLKGALHRPITIHPQKQSALSLGSKGCSGWSNSSRGSARPVRPKEKEIRGVHQRSGSPPPLSEGQPPPLWPKLPPANRHRLLWLLSRLLERRLEGSTATPTREVREGHDPARRL